MLRRTLGLTAALVAASAVTLINAGSASAIAHNLTIPLQTLQVQQTTFGPFGVGNNTTALLSIDRTVTGGLNSLTASSFLDVLVQTSPDNGVTWRDDAETGWVGGITSDRHGQINTDTMLVNGLDGGRNSCRVIATVTGPSPVAVAGSISVS